MKSIPATLYFQSDAELAEGPVWDAGNLFWVDITGRKLFEKPDVSSNARVYDLGIEVGALALWRDRRVMLATQDGFQAFDLSRGKREPWADPESELPDNRFNDGKCDPCGRFVAGTMNRNGRAGGGALYQLSPDGSIRRLFAPVSCSNGLAWSPTGTTLYYIDSPTRRVRAFAYNPESGKLGASRVVVQIPPAAGVPDGMTIDREGNLWIALWGGAAVECWNPDSGQRLARIDVPVSQVTSCTFGGANFDTLFITTARKGLDAPALARQPLAGSIFRAQPGTAGFPAEKFEGVC